MIPDWWEDSAHTIKSFFGQKRFIYYFLGICIFLSGVSYYSRNYYEPAHPFQRTERELEVQADLEKEIKSLELMPGAVYKGMYSRGNRSSHDSWTLYASVVSERDFSAFCKHYDEQLRIHGWQPTDIEPSYSKYRKGYYRAELRKGHSTDGDIYTIELDWRKGNVLDTDVYDGETYIFIALAAYLAYVTIDMMRRKK